MGEPLLSQTTPDRVHPLFGQMLQLALPFIGALQTDEVPGNEVAEFITSLPTRSKAGLTFSQGSAVIPLSGQGTGA
jgi:hypothetical protein